ncbi:hypothetical protein BGZ60DRAFT_166926 [Tricladium varicosporioides]|nr:hypothetical protein BGZ60DRAFT_166926 [Hymenoscyphus varicosporioides]
MSSQMSAHAHSHRLEQPQHRSSSQHHSGHRRSGHSHRSQSRSQHSSSESRSQRSSDSRSQHSSQRSKSFTPPPLLPSIFPLRNAFKGTSNDVWPVLRDPHVVLHEDETPGQQKRRMGLSKRVDGWLEGQVENRAPPFDEPPKPEGVKRKWLKDGLSFW